MELKAQNKSWNDIVAEMGRPKNQLQPRFKELNASGDANKKTDGGNANKKNDGGGNDKKNAAKDNKPGGGNPGEEKKDAEQPKKTKKEKKQEKKEAQEQEQKKAAPATATKSKAGSQRENGETKFTMQEWLTLQEDDLFSFGELQLLTELVTIDQNQTWLRIAARFYDKTGRRVHPEDIREKFEEMNNLLTK